MNQAYLGLPLDEQADILRALAERLGRDALVLEKDVWLCWALHHLFAMPDTKQMAFKGGTTLSKVYDAIHRFSEDIDVTIDFRSLDPALEPFVQALSNSQRNAINDRLRNALRDHVHGAVKPYFEERLHAVASDRPARVDVDDSGEKVFVRYPSALGGGGTAYVQGAILIEFGGRNTTVPSTPWHIQPDIASEVPELSFQDAIPLVLDAERTFWEKATLIHAECERGSMRPSHERWARHWYDLAMLAEQPIGDRALADRALLKSVVDHKKVFYYVASANYDECLAGNIRLVPTGELLARLERDYQAMIAGGMFYDGPPEFDVIVERLRRLEALINEMGHLHA
jgi:hypothetical protein